MAGSVRFPGTQVRMALVSLVSYLREKKPIEGKLLISVAIEKSNLQEAGRYAEMR
jgi:hypothetical protein